MEQEQKNKTLKELIEDLKFDLNRQIEMIAKNQLQLVKAFQNYESTKKQNEKQMA